MSEREEGFYWVWFPRSYKPEWEIMYWRMGSWKAFGYDEVIQDDPEITVSERLAPPPFTPATMEPLPTPELRTPRWQTMLAEAEDERL